MAIQNQPVTAPESPIRTAWLKYCDSVKLLMVPRKNNRPADQYLELRDKVFIIVQGEEFLRELQDAYEGGPNKDFPIPPMIKEALLLEVQAFPRALEVTMATQKKEEKKKWWNRLLDQASTVTGSVKDILAENSPILKSGLTLLDEAFKLFKKE